MSRTTIPAPAWPDRTAWPGRSTRRWRCSRMGAGHPLAAGPPAGGHRDLRAQPVPESAPRAPARLHHTLEAMLALTFGTPAEVDRAARGINAIHDRVNGTLRAPAGPFPCGHYYSAHDPELLRWVHATLLETFPLVYELYVGPLTAAEKDRYCAEASGLEPLLGLPHGYLPRSTDELRASMATTYASGAIVVGRRRAGWRGDRQSPLATVPRATGLAGGPAYRRAAPAGDPGGLWISLGAAPGGRAAARTAALTRGCCRSSRSWPGTGRRPGGVEPGPCAHRADGERVLEGTVVDGTVVLE